MAVFRAMLMTVMMSIATIWTSGGTFAAEPAAFVTIKSAQLAERLRSRDVVLVNVHVPYEGEIPQTDHFIAFDAVRTNLALLPGEKSTEIVLYCRSGRMSEIAAKELSSLRYTQCRSPGGRNGRLVERGTHTPFGPLGPSVS